MTLTIGLDIGTTSVSGVALDVDDGREVARACREHEADATPAERRTDGWAEQDPERLRATAYAVLGELGASTRSAPGDVAAIGLTGQMHGVLLVDETNRPLGNLVTWQDQRSAGLIDELLAAASPEAWSVTGCRLATGYLGATLAWMVRHEALPAGAATACFIHDWVASQLSGTAPCTDPSDAGSAGLFNLRSKAWSRELAEALRIPVDLLPTVRESGEVIGTLTAEAAGECGLSAGTPVCNAIGDNQASFLGSVAEAEPSLLINIGTGGQISWLTDDVGCAAGMEVRYLPIDRKIGVGAGIGGGTTYAWLEGFYRQVLADFGDAAPPPGALFDRMNELAAAAPADAEGLRCRPTLTGTRFDPSLRGLLEGIDAANLTPANLTRAVLTGLADELHGFYATCDPATRAGHRVIVGSGNALRRNPVLAEIIAARFGLPVQTPMPREEAAWGSALLAASSVGALADLDAAGQLIRYELLT